MTRTPQTHTPQQNPKTQLHQRPPGNSTPHKVSPISLKQEERQESSTWYSSHAPVCTNGEYSAGPLQIGLPGLSGSGKDAGAVGHKVGLNALRDTSATGLQLAGWVSELCMGVLDAESSLLGPGVASIDSRVVGLAGKEPKSENGLCASYWIGSSLLGICAGDFIKRRSETREKQCHCPPIAAKCTALSKSWWGVTIAFWDRGRCLPKGNGGGIWAESIITRTSPSFSPHRPSMKSFDLLNHKNGGQKNNGATRPRRDKAALAQIGAAVGRVWQPLGQIPRHEPMAPRSGFQVAFSTFILPPALVE